MVDQEIERFGLRDLGSISVPALVTPVVGYTEGCADADSDEEVMHQQSENKSGADADAQSG
jgi:hypothetical protein